MQYQKNEGQSASNDGVGTSDYRFTITLQDDQHEVIGGVDYYDAPSGQGVDVDSALPLVFIATAGNVDDDPISFAYGDQSWKSSAVSVGTIAGRGRWTAASIAREKSQSDAWDNVN